MGFRSLRVTGPPRSGKTTALERTVALLGEAGETVRGLRCPEIRDDGERVGFEIVDLAGDERAVMAHVDFDAGPAVGKYRVDTDAVDRLSRTALANPGAADCVVIDEIAPMQLESDRFVRACTRALDAPVPVLAAIKSDSRAGFVGTAKDRDDVDVFEVTPGTRDGLPERLREWVRSR